MYWSIIQSQHNDEEQEKTKIVYLKYQSLWISYTYSNVNNRQISDREETMTLLFYNSE